MFGAVLGACVTLVLLGKMPFMTDGVMTSGLDALTNVVLAFLGVLGLTFATAAVFCVFSMFFGKDYSGDTGLSVGMLGLGPKRPAGHRLHYRRHRVSARRRRARDHCRYRNRLHRICLLVNILTEATVPLADGFLLEFFWTSPCR